MTTIFSSVQNLQTAVAFVALIACVYLMFKTKLTFSKLTVGAAITIIAVLQLTTTPLTKRIDRLKAEVAAQGEDSPTRDKLVAQLDEAQKTFKELRSRKNNLMSYIPLNLGLDLRGGTEVRLRLVPDETLLKKLKNKKVELEAKPQDATAQEELKKLNPQIKAEEEALSGNFDNAVQVIRRRLNNIGLAEIPVTKQSNNRVLVQLPGMDSGRAGSIIETLQKQGRLEFRMVVSRDKNIQIYSRIEQLNLAADTRNIDPQLLRPLKPEEITEEGRSKYNNSRLYDWLYTPDTVKSDGAKEHGRPHLVRQEVMLSGDHIAVARANPDPQSGGFQVNIEFHTEGARIFDNIAAKHYEEQFAIVLDGKLQSAPVIRARAFNGRASISGNFDRLEAEQLEIVLKSGAIKVKIEKEYENSIGPTLGEDSIRSGISAMLIGLGLVLVFMLVYYMLAGAVTDVVLFFNMLLIVAILSLFDATLTLPGIAGLVLTVGMAVDANVLIFERIREERDKGNSLQRSISLGYERAFVTIVDANITTLITAIILHSYGTDAVRGFAITLIFGILASMFCSIVVTRWIFDALLDYKLLNDIKMMRLFKRPNIDYIRLRRPAMFMSLICIAIGMSVFFYRGKRNLGHDLTGGNLAHISVSQPMTMLAARDLARNLKGFDDVAGNLQGFGNAQDGLYREFVLRTKANDEDSAEAKKQHEQEFKDAIAAAFPLQPQGFVPGAKEEARSTSTEAIYRVDLSLKEPVAPAALAQTITEQTTFASAYVVMSEKGLPPVTTAARATVMLNLESSALKPAAEKKPEVKDGEEAKPEPVKEPVAADYEKVFRDLCAKDEAFARSLQAVTFQNVVKDYPTPADKTRARFEVLLSEPVTRYALLTALKTIEPVGDVDVALLGAQALPELDATPASKLTLLCGVPVLSKEGFRLSDEQQDLFLREQFQSLRERGLLSFTDPFPRFTSVGPVVADEMKTSALLALTLSMIAIFFYIWLRFQFRVSFGLGAVLALIHDVLFTLGALAICDELGLLNGQIDLTIVASLLTLVGYSLNDTIVVFDRIRENMHGSGKPLEEVINHSINQTLSRTVITSLTTLVVVLVLLFFGGEVIRGFAFCLCIGIVVGTYSSIFIASPVLVELAHKRLVADTQYAPQPTQPDEQESTA
jgi:SecD/SecF fusion protein